MPKRDRNAYIREWKRRNRDRVNAAARARYVSQAGCPKRKAIRARHYRKHRARLQAKARAYAADHRAERRAYQQQPDQKLKQRQRLTRWHIANAAGVAEYQRRQRRARVAADPDYWRKCYAANRANRQAQRRTAYAKNPVAFLKRSKAWRAANPDAVKAHKAKRRIRLTTAPVVETIDRMAIYARDGGICHLCRRKVSSRGFTLDHLVPLSRGGEHAAFNVAIAHKSCNSRKHDRRIPVQVPLLFSTPPGPDSPRLRSASARGSGAARGS